MNKFTFLIFFFFICSIFSQVDKTKISTFSKSLCLCIKTEKGKMDNVLKKCTLKVLRDDKSLIEVAKKIANKNGSINTEYWEKINNKLSSLCDKYNLLVIKTFIDESEIFDPIIKKIGNDICVKLKSIKNLNDDKLNKVIVPFLKRNQKELIKKFRSPNIVVKKINNYLALSCKQYRAYFTIMKTKKEI